MKPLVFLSHVKEDRTFIEQLANDLRTGRINVWFDEWEIPPGESFRQKIFEDGMTNCDLFFVYLTPASAQSYWVRRELDAAFVRDAESRGAYMSIFGDADDTRKQLSLELQALHSPVLNAEEYERPLRQLIARAWEGGLRRSVKDAQAELRIEILTLEKNNAELRERIARLEVAGATEPVELDVVVQHLKTYEYEVNGQKYNLLDLFPQLTNSLAAGVTSFSVTSKLASIFGIEFSGLFESESGYTAADFLGPLIIMRLVREQSEQYYLTDLGTELSMRPLSQ
jgi:hypothetical protein